MKTLRQTSHPIHLLLKPGFDRMPRFLISGYPYYFPVPIQRPLPLSPPHHGRGEYVLIRYQIPSPLMGEGSGGGELLQLLPPLHPPPARGKKEEGELRFDLLYCEQFLMLTVYLFRREGFFRVYYAGRK